MKSFIMLVALLMSFGSAIPAQEESAPPAAEKKSYPEVPKEYEVGEDTVSPGGRFAILYEVRDEDSNVDPGLPNLLVRLKPYAALKEIENDQGITWKGGRGAPDAKWNGNSTVAIWHAMKWGNEDLVVYEIENDEVKRVQKVWPEVVKYFDRDWQTRFLKKYPKEGRETTATRSCRAGTTLSSKATSYCCTYLPKATRTSLPVRTGAPSCAAFGI